MERSFVSRLALSILLGVGPAVSADDLCGGKLSRVHPHAEEITAYQNLESQLNLGLLLNNRDLLTKALPRNESHLFRGMRVSSAELSSILNGGMQSNKSTFGALHATEQPEVAAWYAILPFPSPGARQEPTMRLSVIFQIEKEGLDLVRQPNSTNFTVRGDIPAANISSFWVLNVAQPDLTKAFAKFSNFYH